MAEDQHVKETENRIDLKAGKFEANGNTYLVQIDRITVARFEHYERIGLEVGFGATFEELFNTIKQIYTLATTGESPLKALHEVAVLAMNQLHGLKEIAERDESSVLKFCTLFCNRPGEDLTQWDEHIAGDKIDDWKKSDIPVQDFFLLSTAAIKSFVAAFKEAESIMPEIVKKKTKEKSTSTDSPSSPSDKSTNETK